MGELFNQNEDIFYHFEPLTLFGYDKPNLEVKLEFLKEVLVDCKSPTYSQYASNAFNDTTTLNVCATENHCFWFNSRRFCAPPFCPRTVKDHADTCRKPCFPGPASKPDLLHRVCLNETVATAAKIIRIPKAAPVVQLLQQHSSRVNGKVLVLVRDPRAILMSRKKIALMDGVWRKDQKWMFDQLRNECAAMVENSELSKKESMVKMVRYEDLSLDPVGTTNEIYDFLEMETSPSLTAFLEKSTKEQDKEANHAAGMEFMQVYSTSRNAKQSMNAWRTRIELEMLKRIQTDCHEMMKHFGYRTFDSLDEAQDLEKPYFEFNHIKNVSSMIHLRQETKGLKASKIRLSSLQLFSC